MIGRQFDWYFIIGFVVVVACKDDGTRGGCSEKGGEHVEVGEAELIPDDLWVCDAREAKTRAENSPC